jgi:hypothetical protein
LADFGSLVITWIRETPTLQTPLDQTYFGSIGHVLETLSVTFENLTKRNARAATLSSDAMERTAALARAVQDDHAYMYQGDSSRNESSAPLEGARRLVPWGMSAGLAPGSAALPAVQLCPTGSQLAFGEPRLTPFLFHSEETAAKWLRGSTPFTDFDPTERVRAHILCAC